MTFMDESTAEQWQHIIVESIERQPRVARRVLAMLASLEEITDGFEVDQLVHSLQTAGRAPRRRAPPTRSSWRRCATTSAKPSPS